ncbi:type II toxin-antitoxin system HipA family toxin [Chondromyces apiculatus]|uniref:Putative HipA protein n=1 Tax=Chondromyces apiculatus DSM 436 TaxID=1192034 RepID=A0A017SYV2_9BACT|nr:type II toxin-antitoxin system HipA family toxin [Chondromyces apiculatus]EYF02118.1 putative HipA protein [Chondromyces apiculatus DSM 436]
MLEVMLHGSHVGRLVREEGSSIVAFILDEEYLRDEGRDVLGQQFEDRRHHRMFRQAAHPGQLPHFFANLLPEGALRDIVAAQSTGSDDLAVLAMLGEDLPGAVMMRASSPETAASDTRGSVFDEPSADSEEPPSDTLRFSLAGVQLKFSAVREEGNRFALPFSGRGGRWILKFGSTQYPLLPENEFWTMRWASLGGLNVPHHELVPAASIRNLDSRFLELGENVFAIERYDRSPDGSRVHQEDFAQVRGVLPSHKYRRASYEGLGRLVGALCGRDDMIEFMRRVVFTILSGNGDAHLKNWALVYPDRRTARLSPTYDLVFVRCYLPADKLAFPLAKEQDPQRIGWDHLARIEGYFQERGLDIPLVATSREFVSRCLDVWQQCRMDVGETYRTKLEAHLATLPLVRSR